MPQRPGKNRKSTAISLRLDPKLRFALDLLARKQRRSMTSVIESALQSAIEDKDSGLFVRISSSEGKAQNLLDVVWDTDEADRFVKLAINYPSLLSFDEERMWKAMREDRKLFKTPTLADSQEIRKQWDQLKRKFDIKE